MDYRTLGNSGCAVSTLALGTMTFGRRPTRRGRSPSSTGSSRRAAPSSTPRTSTPAAGPRRSSGSWLAERPADVTGRVVLATKGRFPIGDNPPNGEGLSTRHLTRALDASLRRLGVEHVDLYQAHAFDPCTPLEETLRTFDGFIRAGKISYYGLSNFTGWQLTKAVLLAQQLRPRRAGDPAAAVQPARPRDRVRDRAGRAGRRASGCCPGRRSAAAGCPASTGGTSGRPARPGSARTPSGAWRPTTGATRRRTPGTSSRRSRPWPRSAASSMAQVALAWVTDRPSVTSTILGARTMEQLEDNLGAAGLHLEPDEVATLDQASDPAPRLIPVRPHGGGPARPRPRRRASLGSRLMAAASTFEAWRRSRTRSCCRWVRPTVPPPRLPPILIPGSLIPVTLASPWRRAVAGAVDAALSSPLLSVSRWRCRAARSPMLSAMRCCSRTPTSRRSACPSRVLVSRWPAPTCGCCAVQRRDDRRLCRLDCLPRPHAWAVRRDRGQAAARHRGRGRR